RLLREEAGRRGMDVPQYVEAVIGFTLAHELEHLRAFLQPPGEEPEGVGESPAVPGPEGPPIWERFILAARAIPEEERAKMPADGSTQLDHYLYGWPKTA